MSIRTRTKLELETIELARGLVRDVTEADKHLPKLSYSKLDNFNNCALSHKIKYIDKKYSSASSLALGIGTATHYGLELKGKYIMNNEEVDYDYIKKMVEQGIAPEFDEDGRQINKGDSFFGSKDLCKQYFETWNEICPKSDMDYTEKMELYFDKVLHGRMEDKKWNVVGTEKSFEFVYDNRVIVHGFIDRIDRKVDDETVYRIVDYKSSKKVFDEKKVKTPMQHIIYDLACLNIYGYVPEEHEYDFILINKQQTTDDGVCSKGYLKRGLKKLNDTLDKMDKLEAEGEYPPSPTPLCYWCPYHSDSPNADPEYAGLCPYHSLWTPENKTYDKLNEYEPKKKPAPKRKLEF